MEAARGKPSQLEDRPDGLTGAPDALDRAAEGHEVTPEMERDAVSFLLGKTHRPVADVPVQLDTEAGLRKLTVRLRALDERTIERIETENRSGDGGPFSKLDRSGYNAGILAEAILHIEDEGGHRVAPDSEEFKAGAVNVPMAIEGRFRYQPGVIDGLAEEVRKLGGYNPERVGTAQRVIQAAAGNSSRAGGS